MHRNFQEFCKATQSLVDSGQISGALDDIVELVRFTINREGSIARVFTSRELDALCQQIGIMEDRYDYSPFVAERSVYMVTALSASGGHSRVLQDLMASDPGNEHIILVSNILNNMSQKDYSPQPGSHVIPEIRISPSVTYAERVKWLQSQLIDIRPQRTYVLLHHFDAVIVASLQPALTDRLFYFHSCDHSLALGNHIRHATHVDFNGKGYFHCREREGIADNVVWPLTVPDLWYEPDRQFVSQGKLTTASSGGTEKFQPLHGGSQYIPYVYSYAEVIPLVIKQTGGVHYHIGALSEQMESELRNNLERIGIAQDRFHNLGWVRTVAGTLLDKNVDLYLNSFPWGGGRAAIEVMSVAIPMLVHSNYRSVFLSDENEVYPEALLWRTPSELIERIANLTVADLNRHSRAARRFFEEHHSAERLTTAMRLTLENVQPPVPLRPKHAEDALQSFLDETHASYNPVERKTRKLEMSVDRLQLALDEAQALAFSRQAELEHCMDRIEKVTSLASERFKDAKDLETRLNRTQEALDQVQALAAERYEISKNLELRLDRTQEALDQTQRLAIERYAEVEELQKVLKSLQGEP